MTFREFVKEQNIKNVHPCESSNVYDGSSMTIKYLRLDKQVDGHDFLVLSRSAAEAVEAKELQVGDLTAVLNDEHGWGLIKPEKVWKVDLGDLF